MSLFLLPEIEVETSMDCDMDLDDQLITSPQPKAPPTCSISSLFSNQEVEVESKEALAPQPVQSVNDDASDIAIVAEFPAHTGDSEYSTEEFSDEEDSGGDTEMRDESLEEAIKETVNYIMKKVCENGNISAGASGSNSPLHMNHPEESSQDSVTRASCIQWIGTRKRQHGFNLNLQLNGNEIRSRSSTYQLPQQTNIQNGNRFIPNILRSRKKYNEVKEQRTEEMDISQALVPVSASNVAIALSTRDANDALGILQLLKSPINPLRPCCWHPCCIFFRKIYFLYFA